MKNEILDNFTIRLFDILLAIAGIVLLLPVIFISLAISTLFIGFPPIHISKRKAKNGVVYNHFKIKSMRPGKEIGRVFFELDRINRWGRLLRATHFDELPELFHILFGRMSFVGPRPLQLQVLEIIESNTRELVRPGWTCLAQVWLQKKGTLNKYLQIRLDNRYVRNRSFSYNIRIMIATIRYMLFGRKLDLSPDSTEDRIKFRKNGYKYK